MSFKSVGGKSAFLWVRVELPPAQNIKGDNESFTTLRSISDTTSSLQSAVNESISNTTSSLQSAVNETAFGSSCN